jgi:hypothetical protein
MVLVSLQESQVDQVFEVPGVVRYLFEHGKRANVSNQEVLAMKSYLENTYQTTQKELGGGYGKSTIIRTRGYIALCQRKKLLGAIKKIRSSGIISIELIN